jgi:FkbM family methyltransferase
LCLDVPTYPSLLAREQPLLPTIEAKRLDIEAWSARPPALFRFAEYWARRGPRAKSYLPRRLGRAFGGNWRTTVETPDGVRYAVDPENLDVYTTMLRRGGHEPHLVELCARLMHGREVFFDVGANVGTFSLSIGRRNSDARIVAFEPQRSLALSTARSARLNGLDNILVVATLVGSSDGDASLYVPPHPMHASTQPRGPHVTRVESPIRRLDTLVGEGVLPKPDVIKIDVEGGERDVLVGAEATIRAHRPALVYEAVDVLTLRFGYRPGDLVALISSYGDYEFFGIRDSGALIRADEMTGEGAVRDVLALPSSGDFTLGPP